MSKKKQCKCPIKQNRALYKHAKLTECTDVAQIIEALTCDNAMARTGKPISRPPKFKTKIFKPCRFKETCVPMTPSMHTRLRYIGHCPIDVDPCPLETAPCPYHREPYSDEEYIRTGKSHGFRKKVCYHDLLPGDIMMPTPMPVVKHTDSDKSILNVPSPRVSGTNIQTKRASVKPGEWVPPLPAKSGHALYKPHSGIVINADLEFTPDVVNVPGPRRISRPMKKGKPCHKGKVCGMKTCKSRKVKKRKARRGSRGGSMVSHGKLGVTDGKLRQRVTKKFVPDDDSLCGLDDVPRPEHVHMPNLRRGTLQTHSLTVLRCTKDKKGQIHYGILTGSFNMYDSKFSGKSKGRQALTMSVMAYCLAFHYHPKQWTMKLLDNLVDAGDAWYTQCLDKVHDHSAVQGICEVLPFGKKQTLILNAKKMQVLLCEPEIVGYTMSLDPTVYNLCRGLKAFFRDCNHRAGIMLSRVLKVVIWRDKICFYIFDPAGRDSRAFSNYSNGRAALINVKDLESVAEVLLARSILEDQKFVLAPVKVLKMIDEKADEDFESDKEFTQAEKAMMGYRILNENCAIVNANMHLGDRCFEESKFRQALPIAIAALTYSKISPPNTWFTKTLDKVLRLGNKLYVDCSHPKVMIDMTIDNIPNNIQVGPYSCEIIIYRDRVKGQLFTTKECLFNIQTGLEEFFSHEYNCGILDFNNYVLAIWRQKDMFYLFDPYPRTNDGSRSATVGKACCWMLLNVDTMAEVFKKNWDYLPMTNQFYIHAFKVLKLKKKERKKIVCTLSDEQLPGAKRKERNLNVFQAQGDGKEVFHDVFPDESVDGKTPGGEPLPDEEQMGDIISLVDSIQEDYLPPIPLRYKNMQPEAMEPKVLNLDSPTLSVTQVVPPWPKPRDKTNDLPEPDPDPEPTPPPTPPPALPPEGAEEEEEEEEDEDEDEEAIKARKEEQARLKAEEEEARRKAEELPPAMPPPPPSPQPSEIEVPLAPIQVVEDEVQTTLPAVDVDRRVLLTEDARKRFKLRQIRNKMTPPLDETSVQATQSEELLKPSNFRELPDNTEIIRGNDAIPEKETVDVLPFTSIMAIVTSYKYTITTWSDVTVNFIIDTAKKMYANKQLKFQLAPVHIIPKIAIGHQAYKANIDVVAEGPTWQLEDVLANKFLPKYDRGMITTSNYSAAFFKRNGLYYLFDGSPCNPMGLRTPKESVATSKGDKACFLRFRNLRALVTRVLYNKDGRVENQQFILSRILVRRLLREPRVKLPEDYEYSTKEPKSQKSKPTVVSGSGPGSAKMSAIDDIVEKRSRLQLGYQYIEGLYRIEGTTALKNRTANIDVKACHFVSLIVMLMATMHPIRTWDHLMIDTCMEKGQEIFDKATNLNGCEKRVIKNVLLDGKYININIKKLMVINENPDKRLDQYLKAVLRRLRYVIVRFPQCSLVICQANGFYHLFDPYPPPTETPQKAETFEDTGSIGKKRNSSPPPPPAKKKPSHAVATWTLYRDIDSLIKRIKKVVCAKTADSPEFYTFELTSVKTAPRHSAINYRLSPLFKPDENPNKQYLKRRRIRPLVDEKMYWLNIECIPWSRMSPFNDLGFQRRTPRTVWKDWDIEFPGDLFSLWGSIHPLDKRFDVDNRGKQYLATCVVAIVMTQACSLTAFTGSLLDGVVKSGNKYHTKCLAKIGSKGNHEITLEDLDTKFDDMFPFSFSVKFENVIFGFLYNNSPDRFNLARALSYFFEKNDLGILTSPTKNLAFGRIGGSYFMFDCQSYGAPIFSPGTGASYMLKCESLNRLIYCITLTLNIRRHGQQFHLYSVAVTISEKSK